MSHTKPLAAFLWAALATHIASGQVQASGNQGKSAAAKSPTAESAKKPAGKVTKVPKLLHFERASLPAGSESLAASAAVVLELAIDAQGKVECATVVESASEVLDKAAVEAAGRFEFEPAEIDGQPAAVRIKYRYVFSSFAEPTEEVPADVEFSGIVRDKKSSQPLADVRVEIDGSPPQKTNASGRFKFEHVSPGTHSVTLVGPNFTPIGTEETLAPKTNNEVTYDVEVQVERLPPELRSDLEIIVISTHLQKSVAVTSVSAEQGSRVAGTGGDVIKVVENLPGVARSSVGSGQLVVWGAGSGDTRVYVDGVHIPTLYHEGGYRSVIHSDLVRNVELQPGGYGSTYGRGLGGVVTVGLKKLTAEGYHGSANLDAIDASASLRGNVGTNWRFMAAGRRSHLDSVLKGVTSEDVGEYVPIPRFWDGQARLGYFPSENESIEAGVILSSDSINRSLVEADPQDTKTDSKETGFQRFYLSYQRALPDGGTISVVPYYGTDRTDRTSKFGDIPAVLSNRSTIFGFRASHVAAVNDNLSTTVGVDSEFMWSRLNRHGSITTPPREGDIYVFGQMPSDQVNADQWNTMIGGFAPYGELDVALFGGRLHVIPGARFEPTLVGGNRIQPARVGQPSIGYTNESAPVEPRLALRWTATPRIGLRAAVGIYHQPPLPDDLSTVFGNPQLGLSRAWHAVLGSSFRLSKPVSVEITGFYVDQNDLVTRSPLPSPVDLQALTQDGLGRAYGTQFLVRHDIANHLFGWLSYTVMRSERTDGGSSVFRLFDFDQTHVFTALASYDLGRGFEVGSRFRYATGYPRTPVVGAINQRVAYNDTRVDAYQPLFGPHNTIRIPAFVQLDVRFAKRFDLGQSTHAELYLDIQNVTYRKNPEEIVYNYNYTQKTYITGLPILPVIGGKLTW
jgi:TonB family protein